jgi:hypothetical protein
MQYRFLRNRVRMVGIDLGPHHAGRFPRVLCSANPGGVGHLWVRNTFIDKQEPMSMKLQEAAEGGMRRQYIPARLEDNPSMRDYDPATKPASNSRSGDERRTWLAAPSLSRLGRPASTPRPPRARKRRCCA